MNATAIEALIRAAVTIGAEAATAILRAVSAGNTSTVTELSRVLPAPDRMALEDEALIVEMRQRNAEARRRALAASPQPSGLAGLAAREAFVRALESVPPPALPGDTTGGDE